MASSAGSGGSTSSSAAGGNAGSGGGTSSSGSGGSGAVGDAATADGAPCLVGGATCGSATTSANGSPIAVGTTWVMTNTGGSGMIGVAASVPGNQYASSAGEPAISQQFAVVAGATYLLTVCVPVNGSPCSDCLKDGPILDVVFPGTSCPTLSSAGLASGGNGFSASVTGEPTISLTEGSESACLSNDHPSCPGSP
jgi:hypothetical protein